MNIVQSHILKQQKIQIPAASNEQKAQWQHQKKLQISEMSQTQIYQVTLVQEKIFQQLNQDCFLVQLLPQMSIKIILDYDFPRSQPRLFATSCMYHPLIDESTWQIKYDRKDSLKNILSNLQQQFKQNPPENDPYLDGLNAIKVKVNEDALLTKLQLVDLKTLFKDMPPSEYKNIVESGQLNEYIFKLPEYKELSNYIIELAKANENFAQHLIEQNSKLNQQKKDLCDLAAYYQNLQYQAKNKYIECDQLRKQFDSGNLIRLMDHQLNQLDEISSEYVEKMDGSVDEQLQQYMDLRRKYHKLKLKRDKLAETK